MKNEKTIIKQVTRVQPLLLLQDAGFRVRYTELSALIVEGIVGGKKVEYAALAEIPPDGRSLLYLGEVNKKTQRFEFFAPPPQEGVRYEFFYDGGLKLYVPLSQMIKIDALEEVLATPGMSMQRRNSRPPQQYAEQWL